MPTSTNLDAQDAAPDAAAGEPVDFPLLQARTGRFRHGTPQSFVGSSDGSKVAFIRSRSGTDSRGCIWLAWLDADGSVVERVIVDVAHPGGAAQDDVPEAEKARRERLRESGSGVTAFSANTDLTLFCFALGGSMFVAETAPGAEGEFAIRRMEVPGPVVDPRLSPDSRQVAWVAEHSVYVAPIAGGVGTDGGARLVARATGDDQSVGLANFLAAEEFSRFRGFWWSPDSTILLVEEVDSSEVELWEIPGSDALPSHATDGVTQTDQIDREPRKVRYPAAGTTNPTVKLAIYDLNTGGQPARREVTTPPELDYLTNVAWPQGSEPLISLMNREQDLCLSFLVNPTDGSTQQVGSIANDRWVEPNYNESRLQEVDLGDYLLRTVYGSIDVDGVPSLLLGVHLDSSENQLALATPTELQFLTSGEAWNSAWIVGGNRIVMSRSTIDSFATEFAWVEVCTDGLVPLGIIANSAQTPPLNLNLERHLVGPHELNTTIQWPAEHVPGSERLPVIMNPYGGPHAQRVVQSGRAFAETQWLADQGFCVIVADVRGATGRSHNEQQTFYRDVSDGPLNDQVTVMEWAATKWPADIDSNRVGIMGWSFGGYLAALAVLRRPDVFAAAIAGAPVTDWRLYDTAYTERYLGHPDKEPDVYENASLIPLAPELTRPLLIIHGLSDDNVFFEHSRQLSEALTAAGKEHKLVPLENVTHMTPQEDVAANLLALQRDFFKENL